MLTLSDINTIYQGEHLNELPDEIVSAAQELIGEIQLAIHDFFNVTEASIFRIIFYQRERPNQVAIEVAVNINPTDDGIVLDSQAWPLPNDFVARVASIFYGYIDTTDDFVFQVEEPKRNHLSAKHMISKSYRDSDVNQLKARERTFLDVQPHTDIHANATYCNLSEAVDRIAGYDG